MYGLWGLFVLVPWLRDTVEPALGATLGFLPLFRGPPIGLGYLAAGLLLAIMILPTIASVTIEVLKTTPPALREGALALGATRWEMIRMAVLPYARSGIVGGAMLGLGRAIGETMVVLMLAGNSGLIVSSPLEAARTLTGTIAQEMGEVVRGGEHYSVLFAMGLVLFAVTFAVNLAADAVLERQRRKWRR